MKKSCLQCGNDFIALRPRGLYCSNLCKSRYRAARIRLVVSLICRNCGETFKTSRGFMKFCGTGCRKEWHKTFYGKIHKEKYGEKANKKRKEAYIKNREKIIGKVKEYYQATREERIRQKLEYKKTHREQYNASCRRRHAGSPKARIEASIRSLMSRSINDKRRRSWESLVGYSVVDLMAHLEKQFKPGMSWDNYGKWEIDHIFPRSHFHYNSCQDDQFKRCWSLSNLQPLWKIENIRKRDNVYAQSAI